MINLAAARNGAAESLVGVPVGVPALLALKAAGVPATAEAVAAPEAAILADLIQGRLAVLRRGREAFEQELAQSQRERTIARWATSVFGLAVSLIPAILAVDSGHMASDSWRMAMKLVCVILGAVIATIGQIADPSKLAERSVKLADLSLQFGMLHDDLSVKLAACCGAERDGLVAALRALMTEANDKMAALMVEAQKCWAGFHIAAAIARRRERRRRFGR
jgi:hypothetical protein